MSSGDRVVAALLRLIFAPRVGTDAASACPDQAVCAARKTIQEATLQVWEEAFVRLDEHRLLGLAHHVLTEQVLADVVPQEIERKLRMHFQLAEARHAVLWHTLKEIAERFHERDIAAIVCKGVLLAKRYYPSAGARYMKDIDLWILPDTAQQAASALASLGFKRDADTDAGVVYSNSRGIVIDLHHRMELFESQPEGLLETTEFLPDPNLRCFEPNALVAHLCAHIGGHAKETGPMLCWLVDLGYVLSKVGNRLDSARLRGRMPTDETYVAFLRLAKTLAQNFGAILPSWLELETAGVQGYPLETLFRLRRLALFGVWRCRGWLNVVATVCQLRDARGRAVPRLSEIVCWPRDLHAWGSRRFWLRVAGQ